MKHLNEAELIDYYYAESAGMAECEHHLKHCEECAKNYAELDRVLKQAKAWPIPERDEEYGHQVWQAIRGSLPAYGKQKPRWTWPALWRPLAWVTACALLVASGFFAGRHWERKQTPAVAVATDPHVRQRVVVVFLGDHLDRSERLLVELNHAGVHDAWEVAPLESEARELLATNRLIRQSAASVGDLQMQNALDRLERLLIELANQPQSLTDTDLKRLRDEMNTDGLLFDIRVLRSRLHPYEAGPQSVGTSTKGASI